VQTPCVAQTSCIGANFALKKLPSGANPTIASFNTSVVNFYSTTGCLARFENKKIFFYVEKRSSPLQRWRCSCKLKSHRIGSRSNLSYSGCETASSFLFMFHGFISLFLCEPDKASLQHSQANDIHTYLCSWSGSVFRNLYGSYLLSSRLSVTNGAKYDCQSI
jgi:hypothetical protein